MLVISLLVYLAGFSCSGSSGGGGDNGSSDDIDRSSLPDSPPKFEIFPMQFPNGVATDLNGFGIYNLTNACDIVHYGWDFMPDWASYPDSKVPVVAVADGIVDNVILRNTNTYQGQEHNTYIVWLAVAKEVDVHYTFEPFITFGSTDALEWLEVSKGDTVSAGDIIGYLPKVDGNIGEDLIHIDWKIGTGSSYSDYVCPLSYFSDEWQEENAQTLLSKVISSCVELCYE